jgi:hypothetical protein
MITFEASILIPLSPMGEARSFVGGSYGILSLKPPANGTRFITQQISVEVNGLRLVRTTKIKTVQWRLAQSVFLVSILGLRDRKSKQFLPQNTLAWSTNAN